METQDSGKKAPPRLISIVIGGFRASRADRDTRRKLRDFRRELLDPDGPGFMDPERAAAVVGIDLNRLPARQPGNRDLLSWLPDLPNFPRAMVEISCYRKALIGKTRAQIFQGLNATKRVIVLDEYGNRRTVEIPDHGQRRRYAQLALELEGLHPEASDGIDPIPDSTARADSFDGPPDVRKQGAGLTPADRMLARDAHNALRRARNLAEREVFEEKTGMSPEQFREEIENEADARLRARWGGSTN